MYTNRIKYYNCRGFGILYNDANHGGYAPYQSLVEYNNVFYGITQRGGDNYEGTIFKINPDGSGFTHIYNFDKFYVYDSVYDFDHVYPVFASNLFLYKNNLYGVINVVGIYDKDIIFKINPNRTGFTKLYNFYNNSDRNIHNGYDFIGGLVGHNNTLYGVMTDDEISITSMIFSFGL